MKIAMETISIERASALLNSEGFKNRNISSVYVTILAKEMTAGNWLETHQPIALYYDKALIRYVLIDGQHRLSAIVESGLPQTMPVAYYATKKQAMIALNAVDTGRKKTIADILGMRKDVPNNPSRRVAASKMLIELINGRGASPSEIRDVCIKDSEAFEAVWHSKMSATSTAAFMFGFKFFGEKVAVLADKIAVGENLNTTEATMHRIMGESLGQGGSVIRIQQAMTIIYMIQAWCNGNENLRRVNRTRVRSEFIGALLK